MQRFSTHHLKNQKGLAMVLAVSFIALLSCLAIWLIVESKSNLQTTKAYERTEGTNRLAESGCWLAVHAMDGNNTPLLPTTAGSNCTDITPALPYLQANQDLGGGQELTPTICSCRECYSPVPPAGYQLNQPNNYFTKYFIGQGAGVMPISGSRGSARSKIINFVEAVAKH
jgi:hypothetical protein